MIDECRTAMRLEGRFEIARILTLDPSEWGEPIRVVHPQPRFAHAGREEGPERNSPVEEKQPGWTLWAGNAVVRLYRNNYGDTLVTIWSGIPHAFIVRGSLRSWGMSRIAELPDQVLWDWAEIMADAIGSASMHAAADMRRKMVGAYLDGRIRKVRGKRDVQILESKPGQRPKESSCA